MLVHRRYYMSRLFASMVLIFFVVILSLLKLSTVISEWWSVNVAKHYAETVGKITGTVPFSVFEIFIIIITAVMASLIIASLVNVFRGRGSKAIARLLDIIIIALVIAIVYSVSAGFQYNRAAMILPSADTDYSVENAEKAVDYYLSDLNYLSEKFERDEKGNVINPYGEEALYSLIIAEYDKFASSFGGDYVYGYTPRPKKIANSWLMTDVLIAGISFLPTAEPNYNGEMPPSAKPFTIAHEIAHTKGIMRENDANRLAAYVLFNSDNEYLRYCAYFDSFYHIEQINYLIHINDTEQSGLEISDVFIKEQHNEINFWHENPSFITDFGEFFNNLYLKLQGITGGTGSYNDPIAITPIDPGQGENKYEFNWSEIHLVLFGIYESKVSS